MFISGELQQNLLITVKIFLTGLFLGSLAGVLVGLYCRVSKRTSSIPEQLIYLAQPIPRFVLLPFIVLIFGTGVLPKVIFVSLGTFFPMAINTMSGVRNINKNFLEIAMHYGAKGWKSYKRVILPGSLPSIFAGLRISTGFALTYTVIIEFLTATRGIGATLWLSLQMLMMDKLFLCAIIIALLNVTMMYVLKILENYLMPWNKQE
jgi:NitT/TauT family transport system permease protein